MVTMNKKYYQQYFKDKKFVCLVVRDSAYLKIKYPNTDWSYHDHRDSDIDLYLEAAEYLTTQGYYVFRMGENVDKALKSDNPMIIDYANNGMRSDFLDIFLGANCSFCISTGLGFDGIPSIFRRPILFIGSTPVGGLHLSSKDYLVSFKHHYSHSLKRNLTLKEIFDNELDFAYTKNEFINKNVEINGLSSQEIRDITEEMVLRTNNKYNETEEEKQQQIEFFTDYKKCMENRITKRVKKERVSDLKDVGQEWHGIINAKISSIFLKKYYRDSIRLKNK